MKTLTVFAAALLSAGVLFADGASADTSKTREQVIAELQQARASGELAALNSEDSANFLQNKTVSTKTRAQVLAELQEAQKSGELAALNSEDSSNFLRSNQPASTKTRVQVMAELKQAQKSGELAALNSDDPTAAQRFVDSQKAGKKAETLAE